MRLEFRPYARSFQRPLQTHHGEWSVRQGVLLRLSDAVGNVGWGEIAPIEAFGSESWTEAIGFCQSLSEEITWKQIEAIPAALPACRFGFESAWEMLNASAHDWGKPKYASTLGKGQFQAENPQLPAASLLLPTGADALHAPQLFTAPGGTFKWKIGAASIEQELQIFEELISLLPAQARLRLDANGGLTWQQACLWLQLCDAYSIEFLEQPLPPNQFDLMRKLSQRYQTPIALDESVTTLEQLKTCYHQGWHGLFVIKAAIAGSPIQLREFCQTHSLDLVWSSVFETSIARCYIQDFLIAALPRSNRAVGFGVDHWFSDTWKQRSPEQIWQAANFQYRG